MHICLPAAAQRALLDRSLSVQNCKTILGERKGGSRSIQAQIIYGILQRVGPTQSTHPGSLKFSTESWKLPRSAVGAWLLHCVPLLMPGNGLYTSADENVPEFDMKDGIEMPGCMPLVMSGEGLDMLVMRTGPPTTVVDEDAAELGTNDTIKLL